MTIQSPTKGDRTRAEIVDVAHQLFIEQGYHGTSMRQIAAKAGIALGGIYNHFAGKEELFEAVIMAYHPYHQLLPALESAGGETVDEILWNIAEEVRPVIQARKDLFNLLLIEIVEFEGRHVPKLFEIIFPELMRFAQKLQSSDSRLRDIPMPNLLRIFIGSMFGFLITEQLLGPQLPPEFSQRAFDDFMEVYLHGILAPENEV
jgi:AcrR family transcriptional regulator